MALWFDVEKRYKTMSVASSVAAKELWFDVEKRYKTMDRIIRICEMRCGLM